ncbi:hypothetical protein AAFF_G00432390 [Aldrovandia affinis]|uniref:Uncharacterized protein n=1 Tax=Aldrovandia affinis TaxID=143900 RepID=A0AAD7S8C9_9TELE|nr:hypothetical protein AAFF_G00432390 [Aldrovandia affinis]
MSPPADLQPDTLRSCGCLFPGDNLDLVIPLKSLHLLHTGLHGPRGSAHNPSDCFAVESAGWGAAREFEVKERTPPAPLKRHPAGTGGNEPSRVAHASTARDRGAPAPFRHCLKPLDESQAPPPVTIPGTEVMMYGFITTSVLKLGMGGDETERFLHEIE